MESISQNLIADFNNKISHKINLDYPYDKENTFTYITEKQQIQIGLKEKPKSFWLKLFDSSAKGIWIWLERIGIVLTILVSLIILRQCYDDNKKEKPSTKQEKPLNQIDSIINSKGAINISETDSLTNNLK